MAGSTGEQSLRGRIDAVMLLCKSKAGLNNRPSCSSFKLLELNFDHTRLTVSECVLDLSIGTQEHQIAMFGGKQSNTERLFSVPAPPLKATEECFECEVTGI